MNRANFTLDEPIARTQQRMGKPGFAMSMVTALSLSLGSYDVCAQESTLPDNYFNETGNTLVSKDSNIEIESILEVEFSTKTKMLARLESLFAELQHKHWDGYDSYPLETDSYNNTKGVIELLSGTQLMHWNVFPSPNGTFLLSAKGKNVASISIGNKEFSYAAMQGASKMMGKEMFKTSRVVQIINNIHTLLGYGE